MSHSSPVKFICARCYKECETIPSQPRKYCSHACSFLDNPIRRKKRQCTYVCAKCGISFERHQKANRKYCSRKCFELALIKPPNMTCATCGQPFHGNLNQRFCTKQCADKAKIGVNLGEKSGSWKGGRLYSKLNEYRHSSKKRGIACNLSVSDMVEHWGKPCGYCGEPIATIGLDRIDNTIGYTSGNLMPCCRLCNWMKRDLTLDHFLDHVETIRKYLGKPSHWIDKTAKIGEGSKIWHYATIMADVVIGTRVSVGSGTEIGTGCIIGDDTRIGAHSFLPPRTVVGKSVFISPGVVFCDDRHPVANNPNYNAQPPCVEDNASIGAGSVILPGVVIHKGARIGAGSVVTRDVASNSLVYGEKALPRIQT